MSLTKRAWMDDPLGFTDIKKWVCGKCVSDQILARLVAANLESDSCSYCNAHSHGMIAAPFATVMAHIYDTVLHYYADAGDVGAPWEGGGGWVLPDVEPIDILEKLDTEWGDALQEDILRCLGRSENYWIAHSEHDWSLENPTKALASGWQAFVDTVRHKTRYLFLSEPVDEWDMGRPDEIPVAAVLDTLGNLVTNLNLITRLDCGTVCYRARDGHYKEFLDVSVPPKDQAGAGRMNPVGIPYLYVALERETARREIKPENKKGTRSPRSRPRSRCPSSILPIFLPCRASSTLRNTPRDTTCSFFTTSARKSANQSCKTRRNILNISRRRLFPSSSDIGLSIRRKN